MKLVFVLLVALLAINFVAAKEPVAIEDLEERVENLLKRLLDTRQQQSTNPPSFATDFPKTPLNETEYRVRSPSWFNSFTSNFIYYNSKYYIADYLTQSVNRFNSSWVFEETVLTLDICPNGILEVAGKFYVIADASNLHKTQSTIYKYSGKFELESNWTSSIGTFLQSGLYDPDTNLLMFTDYTIREVKAFDLNLNYVPGESFNTTKAKDPTNNQTIGYLVGIAKYNGTVYVSTSTGKIAAFKNKVYLGARQTDCKGQLGEITIDTYGNILAICDKTIYLYNVNGTSLNEKRTYKYYPAYINYGADGHLSLITWQGLYRF